MIALVGGASNKESCSRFINVEITAAAIAAAAG